ncbi:MAG: GSCFA domain-containing protein [Flavobacterium sp.]|nr:GSCFA domain-containing protein [Flavobacterium sp.]
MGDKLSYYKFQNSVNPFGILFHPLAIDQIIYRAVNNLPFIEDDIFFKDGLWRCFEVHSAMNNSDKTAMLENLNNLLTGTLENIRNASHIVITYGTAWVYRECKTENIVANCHKVSASQFKKEILSVDTIEGAIESTLSMIVNQNPTVHILLTISPVRHLKDGMAENQRSKANLFAGMHQVLEQRSDRVTYFPSYEIMMDELRDYRYYNQDLIHPSPLAIDYIWQKFADSYISPKALLTMDKVASVRKALAHRTMNVGPNDHNSHLEKIDELIREIQADIPHIEF